MNIPFCDLRRLLCITVLLAITADAREIKVFKRGKIQLVDETQLQNSVEYDFNDELMKPVDLTDEYDEIVPNLPKYEVWKNGKNIGFTRVPIVTRQKAYWSTPAPPLSAQQPTWGTPKLEPITKPTPTASRIVPTTRRPFQSSRTSSEAVSTELATRRPIFTGLPKKTSESASTEALTTRRPLFRQFTTKATTPAPSTEVTTRKPLFRPTTARSRPEFTFEKVTTTPEPPTSTVKTEVSWTPTRARRPFHPLLTSTQAPPAPTERVQFTKSFPRPSSQPQQFRNFNRFQRPLTATVPDKDIQQTFNVDRNANKFSQRFGVHRIIPSAASTQAPRLIVTPPEQPRPAFRQLPGGGVDQVVRSNSFQLQPQRSNFFRPSNTRINSKSFTATEAPRRGTTPGRQFTRTWSRTWSKSWTVGDDGHTEFRSNSRVVGNPPAEAIATDIANEKAAAPKFVPPPKPPAIQTERHPYRGPTYNCRILDAVQDGLPSERTDPTCKLSYPGFSADGSCHCTYEVSERDEHGCAVGFYYTCLPR
ncbi:Protein F18E9.3 [Aphelenchoides avenae]|nr:Protein F18E9.3 [Aphelenchus avenae]